MIENKEIRTMLTESTFTNLCKMGFMRHAQTGNNEIRFSMSDIKSMCNGKIVDKNIDDIVLKYALQDIGMDLIREILKRSPIYSELSSEV